jgi:hypothetical protein
MRGAKSYVRRGATREQYDYVMIVCEGSKTEPKYFQRLKEVHRLSNANIQIARPDATDPMSLVAFAETMLARGFDRIYCVFDRDGHANYAMALTHVAATYGDEGIIRAITSVPCFEIWVLLHFRYTSAAFTSAGNRSAGDRVFAEVRKHFADYAKGHQNVYDRLFDKLDQAIIHALRLSKDNETTGSTNPATKMHELVDYLRNIKK